MNPCRPALQQDMNYSKLNAYKLYATWCCLINAWQKIAIALVCLKFCQAKLFVIKACTKL